LRGVSNDNALRIALIEAIAREEEPELVPEVVPVARKIVMQRVWIASLDGQDSGSRMVFEETAAPCVILTLLLLLGLFFPGVRLGVMGLVTIVSILSLYFYWRSGAKSTRARSKDRETINRDIAAMKNELPDGLEFLLGGPTFMDVLLSSTEEKTQ